MGPRNTFVLSVWQWLWIPHKWHDPAVCLKIPSCDFLGNTGPCRGGLWPVGIDGSLHRWWHWFHQMNLWCVNACCSFGNWFVVWGLYRVCNIRLLFKARVQLTQVAFRVSSSGISLNRGNDWRQNFLPSLELCSLVALFHYLWSFQYTLGYSSVAINFCHWNCMCKQGFCQHRWHFK